MKNRNYKEPDPEEVERDQYLAGKVKRLNMEGKSYDEIYEMMLADGDYDHMIQSRTNDSNNPNRRDEDDINDNY